MPNRKLSELQSKAVTRETSDSSVAAVIAVLELIASEHPQLLDFQLDTLLHSSTGFAVHQLASAFDVSFGQVGHTLYKACLDLDKLERRKGVWKDPGLIIQSPNVAALLHVCQARVGRVAGSHRRRKLEIITRRLRTAHELALKRAWIEAFLGPLVLEKRQEPQSANR